MSLNDAMISARSIEAPKASIEGRKIGSGSPFLPIMGSGSDVSSPVECPGQNLAKNGFGTFLA